MSALDVMSMVLAIILVGGAAAYVLPDAVEKVTALRRERRVKKLSVKLERTRGDLRRSVQALCLALNDDAAYARRELARAAADAQDPPRSE
ncbi:hypothetical protein [Microbacterium sp. SORGH_AS_0862]|uniref:hypothetical protein n=1 Tax=Microbacterium sp. SORGH_AS_0862 TaxID=3041789 RepID=UPI0027930A8E|nr:hypothetical protein [Microbacterium sp. SORGH_AS_0862]MDQ1204644.1 hypothetical protein [Microbacterium sp. SORGH_AS_0862]